MRMPFGCWRGRDVAELPDDYLLWLSSRDLYGRLRAAVDRELRSRGLSDDDDHRTPPAPDGVSVSVPAADADALRSIVDAGYRTLAMRCHPDHGGDAETMRRLNRLAELLRKQLPEE